MTTIDGLPGPATATTPTTRSRLYHPGFRHESRDTDNTPLVTR